MKLNFNLNSQSGGVVVVKAVMQKTAGLVVVGEVKKGHIYKGDVIGIQTEDKISIYDEITRIEIYHKEAHVAIEGQLVGVCLKNTSKENLVKYLSQT